MPTAKKRPSKAAKAAKRIVSESKLLTNKSRHEIQFSADVVSSSVTPRTSTGIKPRPDKKRG